MASAVLLCYVNRNVESWRTGCFYDRSSCSGYHFWRESVNRHFTSHFNDGRLVWRWLLSPACAVEVPLEIASMGIFGVGIALWVGEVVNDEWFKNIIAILVFVCIGLMLWKDRQKGRNFFPDTWWFAASMGVFGGFATMIGNVAGPIFAIYLLAMHLPKNSFIGTGAWFFLIINLSKFPLHIFVWKTINWQTLKLDFILLPGIALGAFLGVWLVKKIPEKPYRAFVIVVTALSAFLLLI
jgi:uncharacterized membrane protein YfcA